MLRDKQPNSLISPLNVPLLNNKPNWHSLRKAEYKLQTIELYIKGYLFLHIEEILCPKICYFFMLSEMAAK